MRSSSPPHLVVFDPTSCDLLPHIPHLRPRSRSVLTHAGRHHICAGIRFSSFHPSRPRRLNHVFRLDLSHLEGSYLAKFPPSKLLFGSVVLPKLVAIAPVHSFRRGPALVSSSPRSAHKQRRFHGYISRSISSCFGHLPFCTSALVGTPFRRRQSSTNCMDCTFSHPVPLPSPSCLTTGILWHRLAAAHSTLV